MKYLILLAVLAGCAVMPKPLPEASSGKVSECMRYASVLKQSDPSLDQIYYPLPYMFPALALRLKVPHGGSL